MTRLKGVYVCVLAGLLGLAAVSTTQAAEVSDVNSLSTVNGSFTFGYVSNGNKAQGPFMIDTATGRAWVFKRMEKKNWRLVPVEYVADDADVSYLPGGLPLPLPADEEVPLEADGFDESEAGGDIADD
jgi:hypothetical protein